MKGDRERCLEGGMDDYVSKPVRAQELFEAIARALPARGGARPAGPEAPASAAPAFLANAAANAGAEEALDRDELLDRVGGDLGLLKELVEMFLDNWPGKVAELRQALAGGDAPGVNRIAHTLKGMLAQFGARGAAGAAARLERLGGEGDLGPAEAACAALEAALRRLGPALAQVVEGASAAPAGERPGGRP
jgi:HPt (histidine-containing phosphotransfer) domain-containing protein